MAADRWDDAALKFRDVQIEQLQVFNAQRWEPDQLERLAFYDGDEIVGAVIARVVSVPVLGTSLAVIRYGPLWRRAGKPDNAGILWRIHLALSETFARRRGDALVVFPPSEACGAGRELAALANAGHLPLSGSDAPQRYFIDVGRSDAEVRAGFTQKWRYNLKKSEKAGLTSEFLDGDEGLPIFMELYDAMIARKGFHDPAPVHTPPALVGTKTASFRPKICIVRKNGVPVAAAVIDCSGERAVYMYGATSDQALPLRAGYLMQWRVIQHLTRCPDIRWYDLGGASGPSCSLHQFKRGMTGKDGIMTDVAPAHFVAGSAIASVVDVLC